MAKRIWMSEPLIRPTQAQIIRAAANVLRELYDDGYIDWSVEGSPNLDGLADRLDEFLGVYSGVQKAETARPNPAPRSLG